MKSLSQFIGDTFPFLREWRRRSRWSEEGFERFYAQTKDPFGIEGNPYEQNKFADIIAALNGRRYRSGFEIGCSIGVFTEILAEHCDELLAIDIAQLAVDRARERLASKPWVKVERRTIPAELPTGSFDLIVCADVLYYMSKRDLAAALPLVADRILPGGSFVSLHYLGENGALISGQDAHDLLPIGLKGFEKVSSFKRPNVGPDGSGYLLERFDRVSA